MVALNKFCLFALPLMQQGFLMPLMQPLITHVALPAIGHVVRTKISNGNKKDPLLPLLGANVDASATVDASAQVDVDMKSVHDLAVQTSHKFGLDEQTQNGFLALTSEAVCLWKHTFSMALVGMAVHVMGPPMLDMVKALMAPVRFLGRSISVKLKGFAYGVDGIAIGYWGCMQLGTDRDQCMKAVLGQCLQDKDCEAIVQWRVWLAVVKEMVSPQEATNPAFVDTSKMNDVFCGTHPLDKGCIDHRPLVQRAVSAVIDVVSGVMGTAYLALKKMGEFLINFVKGLVETVTWLLEKCQHSYHFMTRSVNAWIRYGRVMGGKQIVETHGYPQRVYKCHMSRPNEKIPSCLQDLIKEIRQIAGDGGLELVRMMTFVYTSVKMEDEQSLSACLSAKRVAARRELARSDSSWQKAISDLTPQQVELLNEEAGALDSKRHCNVIRNQFCSPERIQKRSSTSSPSSCKADFDASMLTAVYNLNNPNTQAAMVHDALESTDWTVV